ncbi:MAG TPA: GIY-YIG nuclease family protein [bacterium]|jgi:putative endonuclease
MEDNHPFFVYVIESQDGLRYIGQTVDLAKRLEQHNQGLNFWTRRRQDWRLIYHESHPTRKEAILCERFLKSGQGRAWLKTHLLRQIGSLGS